MQFFEKLDLLMKITNTTNSALSINANLDASHISRLRRGKRNALKDRACLGLMADYFAKRCTDKYQRKALAEMMDADLSNLHGSDFSALIMRWLIDDKKRGRKTVETFLVGLSNIPGQIKAPTEVPAPPVETSRADTQIYYGPEGKRQAVTSLLLEVLEQQPRTLLLLSDEPTDWMTGDSAFLRKWAALMAQALEKGNRIKIIHTVSRDLDEMLHAISQWMPLYMSGAIEPYYYPKKRDGIFKKTLFIAPGISVVLSSSVGNMIGGAANLLIRDRAAVEAFTEEFNQYLDLCSPLMRVFTPGTKESYIDTLLEFEREKGNCIIKTESLSLMTMPQDVAASVCSRIACAGMQMGELPNNRLWNFRQQLQENSFTEIISIHDVGAVKKGEVKVASSDMLCEGTTYYTLGEYIRHLEHIRYLLEHYQNFHVHLTREPIENRYMVYAKEDLGAIIAKTSVPPVVLAVNESNLTAAFWDHLRTLIGEKAYRNPNQKESCGKLSEYIERLRQA